ncbi:MAG: helix-turn-helix domain-containing protein [Vagococcus sp.]|uniref:TetR/AcrR family transcriptional regulator n=1 Tax=Vagococcus TaxID=2737 RepID=UPI002FC69C83
MGIREEKKKELQQKIESAARSLFLEKDFAEVTMSQIAKRADVGLGTAYNYYASKEELFLIAGGTSFVFGEGMAILNKLTSKEELIDVIVSEMRRLTEIDILTWRISLSSLTKAAEKKPHLFLDLAQMDHQFLLSVENALQELQKMGQLSEKKEISILIDLIYHTLFSSFLMFIYQEEPSFEVFEKEAKIKLSYLLGC